MAAGQAWVNNHCEVIQKAVQLLAVATDSPIYIDTGPHTIAQLIVTSKD